MVMEVLRVIHLFTTYGRKTKNILPVYHCEMHYWYITTMTAVRKYLTAKILERAGNAAHDNKKSIASLLKGLPSIPIGGLLLVHKSLFCNFHKHISSTYSTLQVFTIWYK